jgi:hypothetical protein
MYVSEQLYKIYDTLLMQTELRMDSSFNFVFETELN